ncbi:hypothetical protein PR048_016923 [Dryococelus australis]|uniref:Uncharacterized protein n=1 Tax=Dryococelus australis TaxID=614101 RepID=A0ABQ9H836_9NEOP|nr:hypothetical protein PR048_016923 [Dryococelus australis]
MIGVVFVMNLGTTMMLSQPIHHQIPGNVKIICMMMSFHNLHPQKVKYEVDHCILLQRGHCPAVNEKGSQSREILNGFWNLANFDKQNALLFGLMEAYNVKRKYGSTSSESYRREKSYYYRIHIDEKLISVCRKSFMAVHDLQNHRVTTKRKICYNRTRSRLHLRRAKAMRDKLKEYTAKTKEGPENAHANSIDLRQAMPTPTLTCGHAFYRRKILTYSVGIHDCSMDVGHMFIWDESVVKRGRDEIATCKHHSKPKWRFAHTGAVAVVLAVAEEI